MKLITIFSAAAVICLSTFTSQAHDGLPACTPELKGEYWRNYGMASIPGLIGTEALKRANKIASMCDIYG
ncbi:hypothetical protein U2P60_07310 [Brucella sp. H1_1004]|uniref:hypothetical protein n=1 Tax=Brucella sp. H1_1004 TaxID=3110109 RepID=UPI0039B3CE14